MIILTDQNIFFSLKSRDLVDLKCEHCSLSFKRPKNNVQWALKRIDTNYLKFCSKKCKTENSKTKIKLECETCKKLILVNLCL